MVDENVFYKPNGIALTKSKYLSTFIIYLKPYDCFLTRLSQDVEKAHVAVHGFVIFFKARF